MKTCNIHDVIIKQLLDFLSSPSITSQIDVIINNKAEENPITAQQNPKQWRPCLSLITVNFVYKTANADKILQMESRLIGFGISALAENRIYGTSILLTIANCMLYYINLTFTMNIAPNDCCKSLKTTNNVTFTKINND